MLTFKEYQEYELLEKSIGIELLKGTLPKAFLHWLKRVLHKDKYKALLRLQKEILNDRTRGISPQNAMVKAAGLVGLDPREVQKVLDKETRYR